MKRKLALCAAVLCLTMALSPSAFAAESVVISQSSAPPEVCYPTSVSRSEDGTEIRKYYDLGPEEDPAGIPRSDFEQDGFRYTLIDLLKQELPENESRQHTETVSLQSKSKDMESVLALLPQEKEFITEDGLSGVLTLQLDTVQVEVAGYGSSTREVSATRSYPNLASQDTANIPKTIEDNGRTLTLQNISWQTDNTANTDGYAMGDRFTAVATYTGSATSSYVTGYTVTADYSGTVSRIALNKTRYVAIFEGTAIEPLAPLPDSDSNPVQSTGPISWCRWVWYSPRAASLADACSTNGSMRVRRKPNEKIVCVSLPDVPDRRPVGSGKRGGAAGVFHRRTGRSGLRHPHLLRAGCHGRRRGQEERGRQ